MIDGDARKRVCRTVKESGALPVARDTPSFAAVLQMLNDGASQRQLEYVRGSPGARSPLAPSDSDDDGATAEPEYTSRAEAKADSLRRQRDAKECKPRSLLGDLPSLERRRPEVEEDDDDYVEPALEVYRARQSDDVPPKFRCAINGHLLKEPARTPQGLVFERATIKLWLETRGSVCPLTGEALTLDDLIDDRDLRARIVSWQLAKTQKTLATSVSAAHGDEDDLYDF